MDKIWLKHYLPSIPSVINPDEYHSLSELMEKICRDFSHRQCFTQLGVSFSYFDLEQKTRDFAAYLQHELKLKKGDRLAVMLPNTFQFVIAFFGALRLGLLVTAVNPLDTPRELEYQLRDSGAEAIVVLKSFLGTVQHVFDETSLKHVIVTEFSDLFPWRKRILINIVLKLEGYQRFWRKFLAGRTRLFENKTHSLNQAIPFRNLLKKGSELNYVSPVIGSDDLALLQYTGGTTGTPKAAMLTHRNMLANVAQCIAWVRPALEVGKERVLVALPLYHIFSLTVCCLSFLSIGGLGILIADPRRINSLIRVLKKEKPMVFVGVNTLFEALLNHPKFNALDFSSLHLTISGGMKLQKVTADRWKRATGRTILEGYGLTEASPVVSVNPINLEHFNGSVGFPIPSTEISIRSDQGEEVSLGQIGELWVKGPQVMRGYWNQAQETENVLTSDGWLKTGDMAYSDSDGFIYLAGRKKEMIIVSGFNVYPSEVESVLSACPGVLEAAVIGVPDAVTGEAVKVCVVRKKDQLTQEELLGFCRANLLHYKVPSQVEFVDFLPKSPVGKILKWKLK